MFGIFVMLLNVLEVADHTILLKKPKIQGIIGYKLFSKKKATFKTEFQKGMGSIPVAGNSPSIFLEVLRPSEVQGKET